MAYTEFYMNVGGGSNLNSGSTSSATSVYTSTAGTWDGTSLFTPTDNQTTTSLVSTGMWASIYPTGNTTTPYIAQVTAVGAGLNGTITLSTTLKFGTVPISGTGTRVCKVGGAWADLSMVNAGVALTTGTVSQSTRINIKAGTYPSITLSRVTALAGTTTTPLWWRGYKTVPGDQDNNNTAVAGTDIPTLTFTTGRITFSGNHNTLSNLDLTGAPLNALLTTSGSSILIYRCRMNNTAVNANAAAASSGQTNIFIACYFKATNTANTITLGSSNELIGCYINGGSPSILVGASTNNKIIYCIFDSSGSDAIQASSGSMLVENCSFYAPIGNGINITGLPGSSWLIANNYFENVNQASKAAINNTSGTASNLIRCLANSYYNCTINTSGLGDIPLIFDNGTLPAPAFINGVADNFAFRDFVNSLAFPGEFENINLYCGYLYPGAVQPKRVKSYRGRR